VEGRGGMAGTEADAEVASLLDALEGRGGTKGAGAAEAIVTFILKFV
jgi:hypothetical protein